MTTTISGLVTTGVGLDPTTQSNPVIVTGTIADPNNDDSALSGGGQIWTIVNQGVILETGTGPSYGIRILSGADITNSGTIAANGVGIVLSTTGTVNNSGTILGLGGAAMVLNNNGTVTNAFGGLIQGAGGAVEIFDIGTVSNYGSIIAGGTSGLPAVRIGTNSGTASSIVVNGTPGSSALIQGPGGVAITGIGTLTNFGSIISKNPVFGDNYAYGINVNGANSRVTNGAAGSTNASILSFNLGVEMSGGGATLTNFGTISANGSNGAAVDMRQGGSVLNGTPGSTVALITGSEFGVYRATTVANYGTIIGTAGEGIGTGQAATIVNGASGLTTPIITGKAGVKVFGTAGKLTNFGTVLGTGDVGASFGGSAVVANGQAGSTLGLIQGNYGLNISGAGTITNFGTIIGTAGRGVFVGGGGTLVNGSATDTGRQIIGTSDGVQFFIYVPATIHNFGTIQATATGGTGASVRAGGEVVNGTAGSTNWLISGGAFGVNGATNLTNYGTISGAAQAGVEYGGGGAIVNAAGALITGANGVFDAALSVTNAGTIIATAGNGNGVHLSGTTGLVSNSGTIQAGYRGVTFDHAGTLINTGTITAASQQGAFFGSVGSVSNAADKSIIGSNFGVEFFIYGAGSVTNSGTVRATATSGIGVSLRSGGTATNNAGGLMQGGNTGAALYGTAAVLANFGTIAGTTSVYLGGTNDRVIAGDGALFTGKVRSAGAHNNTLEVAGAQAGTILVSGLTTLQFDAGASGTVEGSAADLPGAITGFAAGDTIDVDGFVAVSDTYTGTGLILTDAASNHVTLGIQGSFATSDFAISSDGGGGTKVTLGSGGPQPPTLWIDDTSGELGKVNPVTGAVSLVGNTGQVLTDIAFSSTGALYGVTFTAFYSINTTTGAATLIGNLGNGSGGMNALAFGADGNLYAASSSTQQLYQINVTTGQATALAGTLPAASSGDLALDAGQFYMSDTNGNLEKLTISGGQVSSSVLFSLGNTSVFGLAPGLNGLLYGVAGTQILTIDPSTGSVTPTLNYSGQGLVGANGMTDIIPCFCRGTQILTEAGEVAVEDLRPGDRVVTLSGTCKPIRWIGMGRDLVTPANKLARPIIVRQGALSDGVPHRDLYLTHGHALYLDGVLIPVEHLVNHHTILWDERAQVVEYYHVELEDHDVLLAEGALAESYHDAGNRAVFQNARRGSTAGQAKPTFAPVLHGGKVVEAVWSRLLARAGAPAAGGMTADPDLHLVIDGKRFEPESSAGGVYRFVVPQPPVGPLLLRSRAGVPSLLGQGRSDHRPLGVAIAQLTIEQERIATWFDYDQLQLREAGCYRHEDGFAWTDGELQLPARFLPPLARPFTLVVHTKPHPELRYPLAAPAAQAA